jgi:polyisoprenoid-binding protein YceI
MPTSTQVQDRIPIGTWTIDSSHSNAGFEVEHAAVSIFRGGFKPIDAKLVSSAAGLSLEGRVSVADINIDDENLRPHLLSPEFFDVERNPEISFRSTEISGGAGELKIKGELSMAGYSLPVEATGRLRGPVRGPSGADKLALSLEAAIDRTAFGMVWQMEQPGGEPALADEVKLIVELELDRS